jgi:hypothetical protein
MPDDLGANAVSPRRRIAVYNAYAEAQRAVDALADQRFPVERLAIVGTDLRLVEQVTGRLTWGRAALAGLTSGALFGAIFGWIFAILASDDTDTSTFGLFLYGLIVGAVIGTVFGLVGYALTGGRRDFSSVSGMQAGRYEVMADAEVADDAQSRLRQLGLVSGTTV